MTYRVPKVPKQQILYYITANYKYNPHTGVISKWGKPVGTVRKKDMHIVLSILYGRLSDGTQLTYATYAHQVAWYMTYGEWPHMLIDHIDRDGTNNRIDNLRLATPAQNARNKAKCSKNASSRYKGVQHRPDCVSKPWRAYINVNGKRVDLGYHATEEEAALAHDTKAVEVSGEYAECNFGPPGKIRVPWEQLELPFPTE
jgi:hypothetical protein